MPERRKGLQGCISGELMRHKRWFGIQENNHPTNRLPPTDVLKMTAPLTSHSPLLEHCSHKTSTS